MGEGMEALMVVLMEVVMVVVLEVLMVVVLKEAVIMHRDGDQGSIMCGRTVAALPGR